ncbi:tRNA-specific adenosine deaminase [bacterium BMS3Abin04]|nr:tRNA-specific adenosine deaminase [bacterium BMS3Abin04]
MLFPESVYKFMFEALNLAEQALFLGEVPIGAVVVYNNKVIGKGFNQTETLKDPTAHAEMIAITAASNYLQEKVLTNCALYVTAEPCIMCSGAVLLSRIKTVYFGTYEPKFGAVGSLYNLLVKSKYNHQPEIFEGIYSEESKSLLQKYFSAKRIKSDSRLN